MRRIRRPIPVDADPAPGRGGVLFAAGVLVTYNYDIDLWTRQAGRGSRLGVLPALLWIALIFSADLVAAQEIHGRLLDEQSGDPIIGAAITLLDDRERSIRSATSNAAGEFVLTPPGAGHYRLRAEAMGYERTVSPTLDIPDREPVRVELRLSVDAIPLAPLTVVTGRGEVLHPRLERRGYYGRRAMWQPLGAHFLDQAEIRRRHPWTLTGVLGTIPDLRTHNLGGYGLRGGNVVVTDRSGRDLSVCLDGMYMRPGILRSFTLDELVPMSQVLSMEVYVSNSVRDNARCDIMIWTGIPEES